MNERHRAEGRKTAEEVLEGSSRGCSKGWKIERTIYIRVSTFESRGSLYPMKDKPYLSRDVVGSNHRLQISLDVNEEWKGTSIL